MYNMLSTHGKDQLDKKYLPPDHLQILEYVNSQGGLKPVLGSWNWGSKMSGTSGALETLSNKGFVQKQPARYGKGYTYVVTPQGRDYLEQLKNSSAPQ